MPPDHLHQRLAASTPMSMTHPTAILAAILALSLAPPGPRADAAGLEFERIVIDADFHEGYQVEVADVNGDGKPDIVGLGGGTCAWFENPTWAKHVVTTGKETPGIISTATADLDGDGRAEIAIGYDFAMNEPARGKLGLATQDPAPATTWSFRKLTDLGSIHRLRWARLDGGPGLTLVVAPIFGPSATPPAFDQEGASVWLYWPRPGRGEVEWTGRRLDSPFPIMHAIDVLDYNGNGNGRSDILTASTRGVNRLYLDRVSKGKLVVEPLVPGSPGPSPRTGSSEVHVGRHRDGRRFIATIDPWHGTEVAICDEDGVGTGRYGKRTVIDARLVDGHALWVADVDRDGTDEVFAGFRGKGTSVVAYRHDGTSWARQVIDAEIAAQDLRGGDLDGDGTPDVVAIGGKTHNIVWYRPIKAAPEPAPAP